MNKTKFLFLLVAIATLCAGFSSCSKDDENVSIVGKWKLTYSASIDNSDKEIEKYQIGDNEIYNFDADGMFNGALPYIFDGKKIAIDYDEDGISEYTVTKLTKNDLWLEQIDSYEKTANPNYKCNRVKLERVN